LIVGYNVPAPMLKFSDFLASIHHLMVPRELVAIEFFYLAQLIAENQFDTNYHEYFSSFSLTSPILEVSAIDQARLGHVLILRWNLKDDIMSQMDLVSMGRCRFIIPIPRFTIVNQEVSAR
jgi:C-methyltransferase-like protein